MSPKKTLNVTLLAQVYRIFFAILEDKNLFQILG